MSPDEGSAPIHFVSTSRAVGTGVSQHLLRRTGDAAYRLLAKNYHATVELLLNPASGGALTAPSSLTPGAVVSYWYIAI